MRALPWSIQRHSLTRLRKIDQASNYSSLLHHVHFHFSHNHIHPHIFLIFWNALKKKTKKNPVLQSRDVCLRPKPGWEIIPPLTFFLPLLAFFFFLLFFSPPSFHSPFSQYLSTSLLSLLFLPILCSVIPPL